MKTLLKGGRVIDPTSGRDGIFDVLIHHNTIQLIDTHIPDDMAQRVIPLTPHHWVTPGLVDIHVHFRDPGQHHKEDMVSGSAAALAGGVTTVCTMPNTSPVVDNIPTLDYVVHTAREKSAVHVYPFAAVTKNIDGDELTDMAQLVEHGAIGFTDDGHCVGNSERMRRALEYSKMLGVPIVCHAEDMGLSGHGCMNEGVYSTRMGLPGIPNASESVIVARDIELARLTGGHVHFTHVSTKESVDLIRQGKADGLHVTADVTPHHLVLTDEDVFKSGYNSHFKMNPPLRSEADRQALIAGLLDGTLDAIATDHAPHAEDEKDTSFDHAPCGVIGIETALPVLYTKLVEPGIVTPLQLIHWMSAAPAKLMKIPGGRLQEGFIADITITDTTMAWTINGQSLHSKSHNSPFNGWTVKGRPTWVFVGGVLKKGEGESVTESRSQVFETQTPSTIY